MLTFGLFFFFFSSRRRHTRWTGDWSSDVCSSDLLTVERSCRSNLCRMMPAVEIVNVARRFGSVQALAGVDLAVEPGEFFRSEERRVGKECRSRGSPYH